MASVQDVLGVNQTLSDAGGLATIARGLHDGRVKVNMDYYTADATEAAGSTIQLCGDMPTGAKVLLVALIAETAQASLTVSVGNSSDADAYIAAGEDGLQTVDVPIMLSGKGVIVGTATGDDDILLTTAAATMTAGIVRCLVFYSVD